jgi:GTPase SAR1 family protein
VRQAGEGSQDGAGTSPACKIVLLGNSAAGKTSLVQRFTRDRWDPGTCSTIGAAFSTHIVRLLSAHLASLCTGAVSAACAMRWKQITTLLMRMLIPRTPVRLVHIFVLRAGS